MKWTMDSSNWNAYIPGMVIVLILTLMFTGPVLAGDSTVVGIFYYSVSGHTRDMAEAVKRGAEAEGARVILKTVEEATSADLLRSDAVIIGSPVYNANIHPAVLSFMNRWPFVGSPMRDKVGAAFVTAGGISAGEELVQMNILQSMLVFGMIVVGGADWQGAFGASAITDEGIPAESKNTLQPHYLQKAVGLGQRVARLVRKMKQCDRDITKSH